MLTKKLKKIGKECRKAEDPVLLSLAAYVEHVVNYLERAKDDDAKAKEYGNALTCLDLSGVVRAHEALAVAPPTTGQEAGEVPVESSNAEKKGKKKAEKKAEKKRKKAEKAQAAADLTTAQETDQAVECPAESSSGEEKKAKKKKAKKKGK